MLSYLWRNRVRAEAAFVEPADTASGAGSFGQGRAFLLARVHELPERMLALFAEVPGVEVLRPVGDNVVVQVGYRHPLRLESCAAVFDKERFYVFSGTRDAVDVLRQPPPLVPASDLDRRWLRPRRARRAGRARAARAGQARGAAQAGAHRRRRGGA